MPRISTSLLRQAYGINPLLILLLRTCRNLPSARNELRWLREHIVTTTSASNLSSSRPSWKANLYMLCVARARGKPLQYILGNQPFGELEIICKKGVLIPRSETEAYTTRIASVILEKLRKSSSISNGGQRFRILDLCTGTGCISLLLYATLSEHIPGLEILGVDISPKAIALANRNLQHNITLGHLQPNALENVHFQQADIFDSPTLEANPWDLVISNPPYISPRSFDKDTSMSVRNFEPRIALVPSNSHTLSKNLNATDLDSAIGDAFYPKLLDIAQRSNANVLLMEVADIEQARRTVVLAEKRHFWDGFEIWRDWPDGDMTSNWIFGGGAIKVIGEGHGRSVLVWKTGHIDLWSSEVENSR